MDRRGGKIRELWCAAGLPMDILTPQQIEGLSWHISSCAALPLDADREKMATNARAAIKTLLAWCRHDPDDSGLPHLVFRDARLVELETALLRSEKLAAAATDRAWVNQAWSIWGRVSGIMKAAGGSVGYGPKAPAVRFTSLALQWVGHLPAKPDAISMELRRDPAFRKRMCE